MFHGFLRRGSYLGAQGWDGEVSRWTIIGIKGKRPRYGEWDVEGALPSEQTTLYEGAKRLKGPELKKEATWVNSN